jgi:hypothetical protein
MLSDKLLILLEDVDEVVLLVCDICINGIAVLALWVILSFLLLWLLFLSELL